MKYIKAQPTLSLGQCMPKPRPGQGMGVTQEAPGGRAAQAGALDWEGLACTRPGGVGWGPVALYTRGVKLIFMGATSALWLPSKG